ncbi:hypothetical protein ABZX99_32105 [Streptomyces antibioticus]|uniref:hypothetical protein n=1 Tax=Streptomyces antibioticus TaxID=1890 RepID=UPI0033ADBBFE
MSQHTCSGAPSPVSNRQHAPLLPAARAVSTVLTPADRANSRLIPDVAAQHSTDA